MASLVWGRGFAPSKRGVAPLPHKPVQPLMQEHPSRESCWIFRELGRAFTHGGTGMYHQARISTFYAPSAARIDSTIDSATRSICSFDSVSIITRASASVPE
jgi:hypothetical protein